jgi:hypothetical protein
MRGNLTNRIIKLYYTSALVQIVAGENTQQQRAEIPTWAKRRILRKDLI